MAANGANEDFRAPILVEKEGTRIELLRLGNQEVQHHGFTRTRWTDQREVAQIAAVQVEEIGRA